MPPVNVTIGSPQNMWRYERTNLIAVYGVAAALTALGCLAGWYSLRANEWAAFEAGPSTFLRASRRSRGLDALMRPADTRAVAPLPPHLAAARVHFVPVGGAVGGEEDQQFLVGHKNGGRGRSPLTGTGRWAITVEEAGEKWGLRKKGHRRNQSSTTLVSSDGSGDWSHLS